MHCLPDLRLTDPLLATEEQRRPGLLARVLHHLREPAHHPREESFVLLTHVLHDVVQETPAARFRARVRVWLDGEPAPQVESPRYLYAWFEHQPPRVLPTLRRREPSPDFV